MDASKKNYDSSIRAKPVYQSSKNVIHVPRYFEGRKKEQGKTPSTSSSKPPTPRKNPSTRPPTTACPETDSEKQGITFNADVTNPLISDDCDPVNGSAHLSSDNGKEDFVEIIPGIDKEVNTFELSTHKSNNSHATSVSPSPSESSPNPTVSTSKPTKWIRINRPIIPHDTSPMADLLGKHSSSLPTEDHPIQKRRLQVANFDSDNAFPKAGTDIQPRQEP